MSQDDLIKVIAIILASKDMDLVENKLDADDRTVQFIKRYKDYLDSLNESKHLFNEDLA